MKASKTLSRPENWQDFESLCKKLWGEIWKCPEIKKNGRSGQDQSGVDVYGIPSTENEYYGIQCKGKDEYTNKQLTEKEIDEEIGKAKNFKPPLKKFYFATTAVKDAKVEASIRERNLIHINSGLFEVHLFSWEDIVDLIFENKETYDYYVNSINFRTEHSVEITFPDGLTEMTLVPKFRKKITDYRQKIVPQIPIFGNPLLEMMERQNRFASIASVNVSSVFGSTEVNYSYCQFYLRIHNNGSSPIEDYKVFLDFEGEIIDLSDTNEKSSALQIISVHARKPDTFLYSDSLTGKIIPQKSILVGDDIFESDDIFIKTSPNDNKVLLKWKLVSKTYKTEGDLLLIIKPDIETEYETILVEDPLKVRTVEGEIEDYIVEKKEEESDD